MIMALVQSMSKWNLEITTENYLCKYHLPVICRRYLAQTPYTTSAIVAICEQ